MGNDGYLVRVTSLAGVTGLFIWEICRLDGTQIQRSTKSFPTRIEDLFDSTREAAAAVLTDYAMLPPKQRNILRLFFRQDSRHRAAQQDWEQIARFIVAAFRADTARAGAAREVQALVDELCAMSPEFERMWRDNDVRAHGDGTKHLHHPATGPIAMEYSAFAVDGRPDLGLMVYNPMTPADAEKVKTLIKARRKTAKR